MPRSMLIAGLFLILAGVSVLAELLFNVQLPVLRLLLALLLIYGGAMLLRPLAPSSRKNGGNSDATERARARDVVLARADIQPGANAGRDVNVILGAAVVDLSDWSFLTSQTADLEVRALLGQVTVRLHPEIPVHIECTGAMSDCRMPDGNHVVFGRVTYASPSYSGAPGRARIKLLAVASVVRFQGYADLADTEGLPVGR